jgi:hypothetical protein
VAMAAAGITLISGELSGVAKAISLSRGTLQTIIQNLFWAFFYNTLLIPIAAFGLLVPMVAAGAMAFSSIFVVTNSLRLRGYKVERISKPKSIARQVLELTPRLGVSAAVLALLIAVSMGWLNPTNTKMVTIKLINSYALKVRQVAPAVNASPLKLDVSILDANGERLSTYDQSRYGRFVHVTVVSRDLSSLATAVLIPGELTVSGGGGGMMASDSGAGVQVTCGDCKIQPTFDLTDGQYVVFTDFWPAGGNQVVLSKPLQVGSKHLPVARLTADEDLTRQVEGIKLELKFEEPLTAGHFTYLTFEATDSQGKPVTEALQRNSGGLLDLQIVDEGLQTYLRPDLVNRHALQYTVNFPHAGLYKLWFTVKNEQVRVVEYVVEVK